ncbi:MAG TPA: PVC-type heme-binding CxxCH protein, partial [Tepidisphaeraceae bacterium]|nr:PVC-type heme-binding CxxCH protein [Tepidisphaeraceae bacterium]
VAQGRDIEVRDDNLPPPVEVKTNKPGPNADKTFPFLGGEEAIKRMKLPPGCKVNLFASEEQFPDLEKPVQMAFDTRGRLWVAVWPNYPERTPQSTKGDSLLVFEDTNGDGRADKATPFITDLNCPTGFQFYKDGVLLVQAPNLWFLRDTDGDGRADSKQVVLNGLDSADSHHTTNSMVFDPGGAVYLSDGVFHRTQVETQYGVVRNDDAAIYRYEPATGKFDTYIAYPFANPHGRAFDRWGNDFVTDATGNNTYFGPAFSGHIDYPQKHRNLRQFWERPSRPCPGTGILTSRHFPDDWQGNFLNLNVISFQGCYRVKVKEEGSGLWGESLPDLFYGEDPNFRPTFINVGPDGAVYFCDWHNPIIGHLQHHLRDPSRDDQHGRVYRITYNGRPLMKPVKIDGQPVEALLELLKEPENQTRELAKIELGEHDTAKVIAAVKAWAAKLDKNDRNYEHHMMEALWVHQWHNVVDRALLDRMLKSPEPRARAAATRVLCYWRDRVPEVLSILRQQANDSDPRVRLHAVRAASFFRTAEAAEVALAALKHPTDYYLDYTMGETMRQLEPYWRRALEEGHAIARDNPAGLKYVVGGMSPEKLLELPRTPEVLEAIVMRRDVPETPRSVALDELATKRKTSRANVVLGMIDAVGRTDATAPALARLLPQQPASELAPLREQVGRFARGDTGPPEVRQAAWAAVAVADESFEKVWPEALKSPNGLQNLLRGIPLIYDPELRNKAYELVAPLITDPGETAAADEVRAGAIEAAASMNREQKATFSALVKLVQQGRHVAAATRGIRALPRTAWTASEAGAAAKALADWAEKVPADRRTSPDYVQAVQISADLAGMMPKDEAAALRQRLKGLRVAVFVVSTVREQMRYDTPRLVVEAGKPFEIILENGDFMPHNLVVVNGGTRDDVGNAAMKMRPDQLDDRGRPFVPRNRNVLGATKLLEPGQRETLKMMAPDREGEYEYVCTYPGHWEMMWGRLVVTKDVDKYLRDHPEAPAAGAGTSAGAGHNHH